MASVRENTLMLVVGMIVAPGPIFFLLAGVAFMEIAMVAMSFRFPALIVDDLVVIPHMVVLIGWIVDAVGCSCGTTVEKQRREKCKSQQNVGAIFVYA
jgi:hypothetical protein